jgi:phage tail sheath protein FI
MPATPTYPGVYIEEVPSGVRPIVGVATSITAFVGYFSRGPMDEAVEIFSWGDFERVFGGLRVDSEASYAIQQFFLNGGTHAVVVRTANSDSIVGKVPQAAAIELQDSSSGGTSVLQLSAANPGEWGNNLRVEVNYGTADPDNTFNLLVTELATVGGQLRPVRTETFRNLSMLPADPSFVVDTVNDGSKLIWVELIGTDRPGQSGTLSDGFPGADISAVTLTSGDVVQVTLNGPTVDTAALGSPVPTTLTKLAARLQVLLRGADPEFADVTVEIVSGHTKSFLQVKAGTDEASDVVTLADFAGSLAANLGLLVTSNRTNVQQYALGGASKAAQAEPGGNPQPGIDGAQPGATELIGSENDKTGLHALEDVDLFNILCIPRTSKLLDLDASQVIQNAETYCEKRRAFYIVDVPNGEKTRDEPDEIKDWLDTNATLRHKNAALYFPRLLISDPLKNFLPRAVGNSGTIAGVYARTDAERGIWKAPAGIDTRLRGVQRFEYQLTDPENGTLNPLGINCQRTFDVYGNVCWGARTLEGADQLASQWKYIPVRRLALFIEESLYRGSHWVVFEPNDEPLWSQVRLNIGAFMHDLFRKGAFQGQTPREAYLVKCDSETTTQTDINAGIVNIVVGFAPLKPAEFVIIKIQQLAGQIQT